jgi:hypothetical protein
MTSRRRTLRSIHHWTSRASASSATRDHRPDCVQVVIALIITPEGFPPAYEVLAGNTADNTTLRDFLTRIERASTAKSGGSGCAIAGCPPKNCCRRCAPVTRRYSVRVASRKFVTGCLSGDVTEAARGLIGLRLHALEHLRPVCLKGIGTKTARLIG